MDHDRERTRAEEEWLGEHLDSSFFFRLHTARVLSSVALSRAVNCGHVFQEHFSVETRKRTGNTRGPLTFLVQNVFKYS